MLFWNNDYSRGLAGHMRPATSAVRPAGVQCCWLCHLSSVKVRWTGGVGLYKERHRSQKIYRSSEEKRSKWVLFRIAIYRRQVTIPYSALQFGGTPWCFDVLKSRASQDIWYRVAHACGSRCTRGCKQRAPLWFSENICLLMWILSVAISIIDLNVHRWSKTKLMPWKPIGRQRWSH